MTACRLVAIGCPAGHQVELPAKARAGLYGPCPCGWSLTLQEPAGLTLGRVAKALGYSPRQIRKLAEAGVLRTTRPDRPGSHRRVPPEEFARLALEARG